MYIDKLKRDPEFIKKNLVITDDGQLITRKDCDIILPRKYFTKGLAVQGDGINTLGIFAVVIDGRYACFSLPARITITPATAVTLVIREEEYVKYSFQSGSVVAPSADVVPTNDLVYYIDEYLVISGNVPWFMSLADMYSLYDTAGKYAGANLRTNPEIFEIIISAIARSPKDHTKFYRHARTGADEPLGAIKWIALNDVALNATNTTAKLMGAGYDLGRTSALITESKELEGVEELLRR